MKDSLLAVAISVGLAFFSAFPLGMPMPPWAMIHLYFLAFITIKVTK
ncbi:hypothetical protein ACT3UJ_02255 [Halomonas sp. 86]